MALVVGVSPLAQPSRVQGARPAAAGGHPAPGAAADRFVSSGALAPGARDRDYNEADPGAGQRGPVRELQSQLQALGYFRATATGGYFQVTRDAVARFQREHGLAETGRADAGTRGAIARAAASGLSTGPRPAAAPTPRAANDGPMQGLGLVKHGLRIPNGGAGRGTVFANGFISYRGWSDRSNRQNHGIGAWGDMNRPTDYFVALPVSNAAWHDQKVLVTNPATGKQVVALVQDKGPGRATGAKIDLSPVVMEGLGVDFKRTGEVHVRFEFAPENAPVGPVR